MSASHLLNKHCRRHYCFSLTDCMSKLAPITAVALTGPNPTIATNSHARFMADYRAKQQKFVHSDTASAASVVNPSVHGGLVKQLMDAGASAGVFCMIVLGQKLESNSLPTFILKCRTKAAAQYFKSLYPSMQKSAPFVIVTGGDTANVQLTEAEWMAKDLLTQGVSADLIIPESNALDTIQNAIYSKAILLRLLSLMPSPSSDSKQVVDSIKQTTSDALRIVIVTSQFHLRRSLAVFRSVFADYPTFTFLGVGEEESLAKDLKLKQHKESRELDHLKQLPAWLAEYGFALSTNAFL